MSKFAARAAPVSTLLSWLLCVEDCVEGYNIGLTEFVGMLVDVNSSLMEISKDGSHVVKFLTRLDNALKEKAKPKEEKPKEEEDHGEEEENVEEEPVLKKDTEAEDVPSPLPPTEDVSIIHDDY